MALTDSLISYWKLDEASGTRNDAHSTNHLTDNNTVPAVPGKINDAADFEWDNSEFLDCADNASLSTGDIDFTVACWVKLEVHNNNDYDLMAKSGASGGEYSLAYWGGVQTRFRLRIWTATGFAGANEVLDALQTRTSGVWYYVVGWHDSAANTINLQINNGTVNSVAHAGGCWDSAQPFHIGGSSGAGKMDGIIDEASFWKRVLTTQERTDLYNAGAGFAYPFSPPGTRFLMVRP